MEKKKVSQAVIKRLPKYHRFLKGLLDKDVHRISSGALSEIIGFTASQIRQDFNNFGGFGQQGYGYNVEELYRGIGRILGLDVPRSAVIIGAGNMGQALCNYSGFGKNGYEIKALFDNNPKMIGLRIRDLEVYDSDRLVEYINENDIDIAMLTVPAESAQSLANKLVGTSVKGIWNFSPYDLRMEDSIVVEDVNLNDSLFVLSYYLKDKEEESKNL